MVLESQSTNPLIIFSALPFPTFWGGGEVTGVVIGYFVISSRTCRCHSKDRRSGRCSRSRHTTVYRRTRALNCPHLPTRIIQICFQTGKLQMKSRSPKFPSIS